MAKFKKFDWREHIHGLAEAALKVRAQELIREGKMPSLEQLRSVVAETRRKFRRRITEARQGVLMFPED